MSLEDATPIGAAAAESKVAATIETTRNQETNGTDNTSTSCCNKHRCFPFLESPIYQTKYRRWVLVVLAFVVVSLAPGLIYGWPALRSRLILEQQQEQESSEITTNSTDNANSTLTEEQLALMYTVGAWSTQGSRFFLGLLRDRFGTSSIACTSLLALVAGLLGIGALASLNPSKHSVGLTISLFFVGLGSGAQLCVQPVAGLFPNHMGIILAGLSGAFQISGLVFLVLTRSNSNILLSFGIFAACIFVLILISAILLPTGTAFELESRLAKESDIVEYVEEASKSHNSDNKDIVDETNIEHLTTMEKDVSVRSSTRSSNASIDMSGKLSSDNKIKDNNSTVVQQQEIDTWDQIPRNNKEVAAVENGIASSSPSTRINHNDDDDEMTTKAKTLRESQSQTSTPPTAWEQIQTAEYMLLVGWFCVGIVPMQYYVGILGYQFEELGDTNQTYQDLFSYIFAGAAITAPLAGYIADRHGLGVAQGLVTFVLAIPFALLAARNSVALSVQVVGLVGYGIGRMGIFGLYFTNCGKRFGYANYGTLVGLGLVVTALVSLLQYPLIAWSVKGHSTLVNSLLVAALLVQAPYFVWLQRREQQTSSCPTKTSAKNKRMARVTIFRSTK